MVPVLSADNSSPTYESHLYNFSVSASISVTSLLGKLSQSVSETRRLRVSSGALALPIPFLILNPLVIFEHNIQLPSWYEGEEHHGVVMTPGVQIAG